MPKSVNKVFLLGNVGQDPDVYQVPDGVVVTLTLATDESFKVDGEWKDRPEWHSLVAFRRNAEIIRDYVRKGSKLFIAGKLRTDHWDDKDTGEPRSKTKVEIIDLTLLSPPQSTQRRESYYREAESTLPPYAQRYTESDLTSADIPF